MLKVIGARGVCMQGRVALRYGGRLRVDSGCCLRENA
jgi:hypothetical protein